MPLGKGECWWRGFVFEPGLVLIPCSGFFFNGIISAVVGTPQVPWDRCMWSPSRARAPAFDNDGGGRGRLADGCS